MLYHVQKTNSKYDFIIHGSSYIGDPQNNTVLFITKKVARMISNLEGHTECMVFVDREVNVPDGYLKNNCFVVCEDAERSYAEFATEMKKEEQEVNRGRGYKLTDNGYYLGENVTLGKNCTIMPGCLIDHDVTIGDNARIGTGSVIQNAVIGNNFTCYNNSTIGADAFFWAENENGKFRIPSFGLVKIGDHVDIGCNVVIERGFNSNTVLEDGVKIDSNVCIGHDDILRAGVTVTCGVSIAGMVTVGAGTYIGMNASVRQRLNIGENAMIGMASSVITNVREDTSVYGIPARKMKSIG